MIQRSIILACDTATDHPELLEYSIHIQSLAELIPGIACPRRWDRMGQLAIQLDVESNDRDKVIKVAELIINLTAHTPFTVR